MKRELVIVIDFGGQYNQLVARRVRECNVYCEIYSYKTDLEKIKEMNPKGIILTGGPNSCYEEGAPTCSKELFEMGIPVLGLCYGAQLMMHVLIKYASFIIMYVCHLDKQLSSILYVFPHFSEIFF